MSIFVPQKVADEIERERARKVRLETTLLRFEVEVAAKDVVSIQRSSGLFRGEHAGGTTLRMRDGKRVFVADSTEVVAAKFRAADIPCPEELC